MRLASIIVAAIGSVLTVFGALAAVQSKPVSYKDGETQLTGHIYWDDSIEGKRPGVLVVHEWWDSMTMLKGVRRCSLRWATWPLRWTCTAVTR
jgi:hypothetical protein